ncbi:hypothetical protein ElyMa_003689800 [Elysia marginata]|uniref:Uncharacterized protein n=1 Tax=Elysia marginata TaxID=1093978 RepID=A0AAV4F2Q5_9GAST|nr:hypothetical protein ElyMa_003689800 [Elysia marginata]
MQRTKAVIAHSPYLTNTTSPNLHEPSLVIHVIVGDEIIEAMVTLMRAGITKVIPGNLQLRAAGVRIKGSNWRGGVVSTSDLRSGGRRFDSRPCHVAIALGKQFTLTFPSPPTCKMATQLQASNVLVCWGISGAALWPHSYAE